MPESPAEVTERRAARSGERKNSRGEATKQRILLAAEQLFSERGVSAVPLRDIGQAAGQRNHAAVQYYFGDREDLITAVLESRGGESEVERAALLKRISGDDAQLSVEDVVAVFVHPLALHLRRDNHYLAFLSLLITERGGYEGLPPAHIGESVLALREVLGRLARRVPAAVLDERWSVAQTSAVHALARYQSAQRARAQLPASLDILISDLVAFLAAGLNAPVTAGDPRSIRDAP